MIDTKKEPRKFLNKEVETNVTEKRLEVTGKVIKMAQQEYIKHLYEVEEKSLREISEICKLNFRTVQKYAKKDNWSKEVRERKESSYPVLGSYLEIIDGWLKSDEKAPRKQRHTIQRIHKRLQREHGFSGSYGSVKKYVNKKKE